MIINAASPLSEPVHMIAKQNNNTSDIREASFFQLTQAIAYERAMYPAAKFGFPKVPIGLPA
jgi:hypothetical protein